MKHNKEALDTAPSETDEVVAEAVVPEDLPPEPPRPRRSNAAATAPAAPRSNVVGWLALVLALAAAALAGVGVWQMYAQRLQIELMRGELASQLRQADTSVGAVRTLGEQQQNALNRLQGEIGALESKIADANSQTRALADLFQRNASTADERTLVQVEQAVTLAIQQLQLANNAEAALAALAVADEELSTGTQAYFQELRRALAQDMAALRDARRLDVSGLAMRIENVLKKIDALPLAYEFTPKDTLAAPQQAPAAPADEDGWLDRMRLGAQQLADEVWRDVSSMVRIERTNGAVSPALLSPEQGTYLRENVKVRLLTARLALFMRDVGSFQTDLQQARAHLERYFDTRQEAVQSAVADLGALLEQPMQESLPTLDNTLAALRQAQVRLENASRLGTPASEQH